MPEHILFLTGRLADKQLHRVLDSMQPTDFGYKVKQIGISVAALMTAQLIERRVPDAMGADRIMVPGRCRGDLERLAARYRVPVVRGPDDLKAWDRSEAEDEHVVRGEVHDVHAGADGERGHRVARAAERGRAEKGQELEEHGQGHDADVRGSEPDDVWGRAEGREHGLGQEESDREEGNREECAEDEALFEDAVRLVEVLRADGSCDEGDCP